MTDSDVETDQSQGVLRQQLEQSLRDIKPPESVDWWPLAPAWWILAIALIVIAALVFFKTAQRVYRHHKHDPDLSRLDEIFNRWFEQPDLYYQNVNKELRLAALADAHPSPPTRLTGHAWVDWMENKTGYHFSDSARFALAESCYQRKPIAPTEALHTEIHQWLRRYKAMSDSSRLTATGETHA